VIGLFKQKSPGNVAILLLFGLLLKLPLFLYPKPIVATVNDGRLYQLLISYLPVNGTGNAILCSLISFLLLYIQGLMINYLVNEYRLITKPNYLPGMTYLLITSLLPDWNYLSAPLVANTFIIWMFIKLFRLYNSPKALAQVFNIGLVAGISSYIFFPSALFVFCILIGLMILRPFRLNEAVLLLLGGITPYYFHAVYLFLNDQLSMKNFFPHISIRIPAIKNTIWLAISTLLLAIPFLIGGYYVQTHLRKMLIQVRKNWSILLLYLVLSFVIPFVNSDHAFHAWLLISTPFAAFHACAYFYPPRKALPLLLFYITVGFILFQQYGTPGWH
jgi:hypothetical protein